jgi:uncharacterized damage-inducible protein DinB
MDPNALLGALLDYDVWATRQLLGVCRGLTPGQFEQPLPIGLGSLERTLTHLVSATFFFADRLARRPARPRLERDGQPHGAADLSERFEHAAEELAQAVAMALANHALTDMLQWTDTDVAEPRADDTVGYAVALAQIIDHGIHHRTQTVDMLALLGARMPMEWHPFDWDEAIRLQP